MVQSWYIIGVKICNKQIDKFFDTIYGVCRFFHLVKFATSLLPSLAGDNILVWFFNGPKLSNSRMVPYPSHDLNTALNFVRYSNFHLNKGLKSKKLEW